MSKIEILSVERIAKAFCPGDRKLKLGQIVKADGENWKIIQIEPGKNGTTIILRQFESRTA